MELGGSLFYEGLGFGVGNEVESEIDFYFFFFVYWWLVEMEGRVVGFLWVFFEGIVGFCLNGAFVSVRCIRQLRLDGEER